MYKVTVKTKHFSGKHRNDIARVDPFKHPIRSSYYVCPHCTVALNFVMRKTTRENHQINLLYFCCHCGGNFFVKTNKTTLTINMFEIKFDDDNFEFDDENQVVYDHLFKKYIDNSHFF